MRFLCLHGRGTNSDIFEAQLASLRSRISPEHSFDFVDAEFDCPPAPGVEAYYPPPYCGWYSAYGPPSIWKTHAYLRDIIAADGPYDGVVAFSEGAAVAASMMLYDQAVHQHHEPLFKLGIFFNSVMLFSPSEKLGVNITERLINSATKYTGYMPNLAGETSESGAGQVPDIFAFSASIHASSICVPTLHVIGSQDVFSKSSQELAKLCDASTAKVLVHDGGHALPREGAILDQCGEMFESVVSLASLGQA